MRKHSVLLAVAFFICVLTAFLPSSVSAQTPAAAALSGQVNSSEEGAMEGVVVTAKKAGATIAISVVSDDRGHYRFPAGRLDPGDYTLKIRAIGYDLDGPKTVTLAAPTGATADLKLRKTRNLGAQLTNAEWMMSIPGTPEQKMFMDRCTSCHSLERPMRSTYTSDEFLPLLTRMGSYAPGTQPSHPQVRLNVRPSNIDPERLRPRADYLASINLSAADKWKFPLKTLPRPKGRATHVIITEYDLPRADAMPHDVVLDADGQAWYSDFGQQFLGKLDPKSGKVTDYPVPLLKPALPTGLLDLELDKSGNLWAGMMLQAGIAKFDRKTDKLDVFPLPKDINNNATQQAMVMPNRSDVDGKVWMNSVGLPGVHRMDLATKTFETFQPYKSFEKPYTHSVYGIAADSKNNLYFFDFSVDYVGRIDAKTGKIVLLQTPTRKSNPRRGYMDPQDKLWFTEYRANKLAVLDTKTETFTEWPLAMPYALPYDVRPDKNGELWTGGMSNDRVTRYDPKSGQEIDYLLPKPTNIRRVWVDNTTTPATFWAGSNLGASIVKVEPLD